MTCVLTREEREVWTQSCREGAEVTVTEMGVTLPQTTECLETPGAVRKGPPPQALVEKWPRDTLTSGL